MATGTLLTMWMQRNKTQMPTADSALPDRADSVRLSGVHFVNESSILPPYPEDA